MKHEIFSNSIKIEDCDITFEQIYKKDYIPIAYLGDIKKANILIIPNETYREADTIWFPETTREFFDYMRDNSSERVITDITISDEDFVRLEMHSAVIEVATLIVQWGVLPIATSMIASFLYDLVKRHHRKPEETSAKVKIVAEETETKKSKMIIYEGPVDGIEETLSKAADRLFSED